MNRRTFSRKSYTVADITIQRKSRHAIHRFDLRAGDETSSKTAE
jgi:hypothetical protein